MKSMSTILPLLLTLATAMLAGCNARSELPAQQALQGFASDLKVQYQVVDNLSRQACHQAGVEGDCFTARITLTLPEQLPVAPQLADMELYFSHISPIKAYDSDFLSIQHVNGDLHKLRFIQPAQAGQSVTVLAHSLFWHAARSDVVPNWFVTAEGLHGELITSTRGITDAETGVNVPAHAGHWDTPAQSQRFSGDALPLADANWLYQHYQPVSQAAVDADAHRVIPQVSELNSAGGQVTLSSGLALSLPQQHPALAVMQQWQLPVNEQGLPVIIHNSDKIAGAYTLTVTDTEVTVTANSDAGVSYALMTLIQLYEPDSRSLPKVHIEDGPAYDYRGMHIDIARNFPGKQALFGLLEQMYRFKLNKLHLHLADDEAWRLEIAEMPELTEVGAYRCADFSEQHCLLPQLGSGPDRQAAVNGYLSAEDYQALLVYAAQRHIEVIPSFDMPGHARAAIKSIESRIRKTEQQAPVASLTEDQDTTQYRSVQYYNDNTLNPCLDSSYQFVEVVLQSLKAMHEEAGVPLHRFHMGADETGGAWVESPACQAMIGGAVDEEARHQLLGHFVSRVKQITAEKGLQLAGWSDGMATLPDSERDSSTLVTLWSTLYWDGQDTAYEWLGSQAQTVYSFPDVLYFDFPYRNHPEEPGYYWGSKNTDTFKVFQFTPQLLPLHQYQWQDRMGHAYQQPLIQAPRAATGIQGQVWTEVIRTPQTLEYMLYPRLFALAERAWHEPEWLQAGERVVNGDSAAMAQVKQLQYQTYQGFTAQLVRYALPQLAQLGSNFRLPPPGVQQHTGGISVNSPFVGLQIEYASEDGNWQPVAADTRLSAAFRYRTTLAGTDKSSRSVSVADPD